MLQEGYVRVAFDAGKDGKFATGSRTVFDVREGTPASALKVPVVLVSLPCLRYLLMRLVVCSSQYSHLYLVGRSFQHLCGRLFEYWLEQTTRRIRRYRKQR